MPQERTRSKQTTDGVVGGVASMPIDGVLPWMLENILMAFVRCCEQQANDNPDERGFAIAAAAASWIASDVVCTAWEEAARNGNREELDNASERAAELYDSPDTGKDRRIGRLALLAGWEQQENGEYTTASAGGTVAIREMATQTLMSELHTSNLLLCHFQRVEDAHSRSEPLDIDLVTPVAVAFHEQAQTTLLIAVQQIQITELDLWHLDDPYEDEALVATSKALDKARNSTPIHLDGWLHLPDSATLLAAEGADDSDERTS